MRDKKRIKRILKMLEELWNKHPDQRLGQLLENYVFGRGVIWFKEDDDTEAILKFILEGS